MDIDIKKIESLGYRILKDGTILSRKNKQPLRPSISNNGYKRIWIHHEGNQFSVLVHRLVCAKHRTKKPGLDCVNHKDGNKLNNHYRNLEWCTRSQNAKHAYAIGLVKPISLIGIDNVRSKPVLQMQGDKVIKEFESINLAMKAYGSGIYKVINRWRRTAYGYKWVYKNDKTMIYELRWNFHRWTFDTEAELLAFKKYWNL